MPSPPRRPLARTTPSSRSSSTAPSALARRLREELEAYLTEDMPALAELLKEVRVDLRSRGIVRDPEAWQKAIDEELRVLLAQRKHRQAKARLLASLGVGELVERTAPAKRPESKDGRRPAPKSRRPESKDGRRVVASSKGRDRRLSGKAKAPSPRSRSRG